MGDHMLRKLAISALIGAAIYLLVALGLVFSQSPGGTSAAVEGNVSFAETMAVDYSAMPEPITFAARDGAALPYRRYDAPGPAPFLILVHGSAWHGMQFHQLAQALSEAGTATVIVPDMRGHGFAPARRGDVDYIGQMEDDIADLIASLERPADTPLILGGHSSGGGFVVRFAGGRHVALADGLVLMAPFLQHDAPTTRPNAGGWAQPAVRRIIGLTMLDMIGITALHHLPALSFAMPQQVLDGPYGATATTLYSFRLNAGFSPRRDYGRDLAGMKVPFLLVAGTADETFITHLYEETIAPHAPGGTYVLVDGANHIGLVSDTRLATIMTDWFSDHFEDGR